MGLSKINRRLVNYEITEFYCVNANLISLPLFIYNGSGQTCGGWNCLLYSIFSGFVGRDLREVGGEKLMDKEELKLQLMKWHNKMSAKFGFNMEDSSEFSELMEQLDEPKKVIIPQFVADWIKESKIYYVDEVDPLGIIYWMGDYIGSKEPHCEWLKNIYNQKLLLNAIVNGYEVED